MNSSDWNLGYRIKWEWYLSAFGEGKESFLLLFLWLMGKAVDLSEFDKGQI